ncbi:MAG TPA: class I tRNA ligase family protein, partial [Thermoplasmata archaeon]
RDGRFGNFLTEAKDWALSRNRYWGTPLPVWVCDSGHPHCVGSFAELATLTGRPLEQPFDPHRVTVDRLTFPCPTCGKEARREPYTIDAWYDSGSAPFAQFHYPFEPGPFDPAAPLDFIAEGVDQTRGWFYALLVLSTALFDRPAYKVCVVNGHAVDPTGLKMSKSKGNVLDPMALLERYGGDAVRWSFLVIDYTEPIAVSETQIRQSAARTLGTLLNVLEFYRQNARADGHRAATSAPPPSTALDRWLLSRLEGLVTEVDRGLDTYEARRSALAIRAFVDDLSTWYLRRSRPRFWSEEATDDKRAASDVLSYALVTVARVLAPLAPFTAEHVYGEMLGATFDAPESSVHLAKWPEPAGRPDEQLESGMSELRALVEIGRELRQRAQVKSRIPLEEFLVGDGSAAYAALGAAGEQLLAEELNVRTIRSVPIGASATSLPADEWVVREEEGVVRAALRRRPSPELLREGLVREVLRRLQMTRKELGLRYRETIALRLHAEGDLYQALLAERDRIRRELLCGTLDLLDGPPPDSPAYRRWEFEGYAFSARLDPVSAPPEVGASPTA